jgi:outer membrane lipoprotein-sorting protein
MNLPGVSSGSRLNVSRLLASCGIVGAVSAAMISAAMILGGAGHRVLAAAQSPSSHLDTVLSQMDAASARFHSAEASIRKEQYQKIVRDTTTQTGTIYFLRNGAAMQIGARFDPPAAQIMEYKNGTVRLYSQNTNHIEQYSTSGANQARFESYLTLGFGGSGHDLAKAWTITDQGSEQMSDGGKSVAVEKLDLVSREPSVRANFTHITIWVDPVGDVSLKQVFYTPSGDIQTATYSNIRLNQPIDLKAFAIKCNAKCA